jgi:hypothetical protein
MLVWLFDVRCVVYDMVEVVDYTLDEVAVDEMPFDETTCYRSSLSKLPSED